MTHEQRARECAPEMVRRVAHELGASWSDMTVVAAERFVSDYLTALLAEVERETREACAKVADNEAALIHSVSFGKERHDYAEERARLIAAAIRAERR